MADSAGLIRVRGLVQGVGFRPFVWRLARRLGVRGGVWNDGEGVNVRAEGTRDAIHELLRSLRNEAPPGACVEVVDWREAEPKHLSGFVIGSSPEATFARCRVPPDRAACPDCVREVFSPTDRRASHPFASCTACGPRWSILEAMPYDRARTTLAGFALCPACAAEYASPDDRRFHAQPVCCPSCGPQVAAGAIEAAAQALDEGRIVALKGLGGYQLLVRADLPGPVERLRRLKRRPAKPFAVMARSLADARRLAVPDEDEMALLVSAENPVVLLSRCEGAPLAEGVAPGLGRIGVMLPTTPLHHLLLSRCEFPVVATSGNLGGEPIALDDEEAQRLAPVADVFLHHDRPIAHRADDSVAQVVAGRTRMLRLARGYAPLPLPALEGRSVPPLLAVGGQQKAALALWTGSQAVLGPHLGDLDDLRTREAFDGLARSLPALYGCTPEFIACDQHPDYASTRWAEASGLPLVRVQHHHAHAAACMAEHGLSGETLAFAWDGTGFGPDGTIWGGEALLARFDDYERVARLRPFALPGGEAAIRQPARIALALLAQALGGDAVGDPDLPRLLGLPEASIAPLLRMIEAGINCPATSSMGRLFDGMAALALGMTEASYDGEPAARLEAIAVEACCPYALPLGGRGEGDWRPLVRQAWHDRKAGAPPSVIAWRFHEAVAGWAATVAARHKGLPVVLGGGCFANARLLRSLLSRLSSRAVFAPERVPPGDGGLAVGQLAVALALSP